MRLLAIGDIHGCSHSLDLLLAAVDVRPEDQIVTLGDYVDRGPDSFGVIERLIALHRTGRVVALRGNHEQMMLEARQGMDKGWLLCGGRETLASYAVLPDAGKLVDVPDHHWEFLETALVNWYETDTHLFVHAGAYPDLPLAEQPEYMLLWESLDNPPPHESGKVLICGHTAQKSGNPLNLGHTICIDTWAHSSRGWLTCLDVHSGKMWQANEIGQQRTAWVDEFLR